MPETGELLKSLFSSNLTQKTTRSRDNCSQQASKAPRRRHPLYTTGDHRPAKSHQQCRSTPVSPSASAKTRASSDTSQTRSSAVSLLTGFRSAGTSPTKGVQQLLQRLYLQVDASEARHSSAPDSVPSSPEAAPGRLPFSQHAGVPQDEGLHGAPHQLSPSSFLAAQQEPSHEPAAGSSSLDFAATQLSRWCLKPRAASAPACVPPSPEIHTQASGQQDLHWQPVQSAVPPTQPSQLPQTQHLWQQVAPSQWVSPSPPLASQTTLEGAGSVVVGGTARHGQGCQRTAGSNLGCRARACEVATEGIADMELDEGCLDYGSVLEADSAGQGRWRCGPGDVLELGDAQQGLWLPVDAEPEENPVDGGQPVGQQPQHPRQRERHSPQARLPPTHHSLHTPDIAGQPVTDGECVDHKGADIAALRASLFAKYAGLAAPRQPTQPAGATGRDALQHAAAPPTFCHPPSATGAGAPTGGVAEAAAEACVAQTCYPHLSSIFQVFPTQQAAFECADQLNAQLPLLGDRTYLTLQPLPTDSLQQQQQQQRPRQGVDQQPRQQQAAVRGAAPSPGGTSTRGAAGCAGDPRQLQGSTGEEQAGARAHPGSRSRDADRGGHCGQLQPQGHEGGAHCPRERWPAEQRQPVQHAVQRRQERRACEHAEASGEALDYLRRAERGLLPSSGGGYCAPELKRPRSAPQQTGTLQARERLRAALRAHSVPATDPTAEAGERGPSVAAAERSGGAARRPVSAGSPASGGEGFQQAEGASGVPNGAAAGSPGAGGLHASAGDARALPEQAAVALCQAPHAQQLREECVKVFCLERRARSGAYFRSFAAATYPAVWRRYREAAARGQALHLYEVVREGRPCHLYLDLEFPRELNPAADGDRMVDSLVDMLREQLWLRGGLALDYRCVYELDSSTPTKFSRHLHIRLPGHAFATNAHAGALVAAAVAAAGPALLVVRSQGTGGQLEYGPFVDAAVYSRNRHFRMAYCCKGGKDAALLPTARYATAPTAGAAPSPTHVLLDTLACNVHPSAKLLQMALPANRTAGRGGALPKGTVVSGEAGGPRVAWKHDAADDPWEDEERAALREMAEAALPFVERAASARAGEPARARTVAFCGSAGTVAYSMIGPGSHFCERIGRRHASNHVFFVVNFADRVFAQKCHDPDCAHYRSSWMPLPPELCL